MFHSTMQAAVNRCKRDDHDGLPEPPWVTEGGAVERYDDVWFGADVYITDRGQVWFDDGSGKPTIPEGPVFLTAREVSDLAERAFEIGLGGE